MSDTWAGSERARGRGEDGTKPDVQPPGREDARFELRSWGDFALIDGLTGSDVSPRGRKARALIAVLAGNRGTAVSRERLAALLWSDRGEEQARASLRQSLQEVRHLVGGPRPLLEIGRGRARLKPELLRDSCDRIEALARDGDYAGLADALPGPGCDLFQDLDGLAEGFDEWLAAERPSRREALLAAARNAAGSALGAGSVEEARLVLGRLQAFEPYDEATVRLGMQVDAASGDMAAVERRFARFRERLRQELGVAPSPETKALHHRLLERAPQPAAPKADDGPPRPPVIGAEAALEKQPRAGRRRLPVILLLVIALAVTAAALIAGLAWRRAADVGGPASIAVLPFRSVGGDESHFAEGVAEEILSQLAREPQLRVAGRTSSWMFRNAPADARAVGQRLGVDYLLEGSVRRAGNDVRVNVALVRAADGMQMWSEAYAGRLDDIFLIQDRIGGAVARNLRLRLLHTGARSRAGATSGEVYRLYLTARSLMRERQSAKVVTAIELLREAVRRDPRYAPAWSRLGAAIVQQQTFEPSARRDAARALAIRYVRQALRLAPELAEAHAAMAMILGIDSPAASRHIRRAAELDPNDPEIQLYLGQAHAVAGDFRSELAAFARAAEIDPFYRSAPGVVTRVAPSFGEDAAALRLIGRLANAGSPDLMHLRGHLSWGRGDHSQAAREFSEALRRVEPHSGDRSDMHLGEVLRQLGQTDDARRVTRFDEGIWRLWEGQAPPLAELRRRNRTCLPSPICGGEANDHDGFYAVLAAKLLLNAGRGRELAQLFDSEAGLLTLSRAHLTDRPVILIGNGPLVAAALRAAGRDGEADRLLALIDRNIRSILSRGRVPHWFYAHSAQTWALQGRSALALSALERALERRWFYRDEMALADIGDEPAFRSLRGDPRFERIRESIRSHFDRERAELARAGM